MRILRRQDVVEKVKIKPSTIDLMERDGQFPKRIGLGRGRAVGWLESEVEDWIAARIAERDRGAQAA